MDWSNSFSIPNSDYPEGIHFDLRYLKKLRSRFQDQGYSTQKFKKSSQNLKITIDIGI